jgi:hypothetical protein
MIRCPIFGMAVPTGITTEMVILDTLDFPLTMQRGSTMAKRKKQSSKVQKRKGAQARAKAKKPSKAARGKAVTKPPVARAKPKRAPVKKAARKERMKQPVAPAVETLSVEHPAPEFEEVRQVSPGPDEPEE